MDLWYGIVAVSCFFVCTVARVYLYSTRKSSVEVVSVTVVRNLLIPRESGMLQISEEGPHVYISCVRSESFAL